MGFIIGLLTLTMVLLCLAIVFLVLIQLPKREAGTGLALGENATNEVFGAGSGTVLSKVTKYAATAFFVLALLLSVLQQSSHSKDNSAFVRALKAAAASAPR